MKTVTLSEVLEYRNKPYGGFLGNVTFCDETYKDYKDLKDLYNIPPEVNKFCVVHSVDFIFLSLLKSSLYSSEFIVILTTFIP